MPPDQSTGALQCHRNSFPPQRFLRKPSEHFCLPVSNKAIKSRFHSKVKSEINLNFFGSPKPWQFQKKILSFFLAISYFLSISFSILFPGYRTVPFGGSV